MIGLALTGMTAAVEGFMLQGKADEIARLEDRAQAAEVSGAETVDTLQVQVEDLRSQLASVESARTAVQASLRSQLSRAQRRATLAVGCIDDIVQEYNSASFVSELPRHFGAALNGPNCSALGYHFG